MTKMTIEDLSLKNKRVIMRADFNVPLDERGEITDDTRISLALPTINYLLDQGASLILMSHLGRPKGKKSEKNSLKPVAKHLEKLTGKKVTLADDCIGDEVQKLAKNLEADQILLLENLRFHSAEEKPDEDPNFAKSLAALADLYVNDAFGTAHRKHSSTYTITKYFPKKSAMGFLMHKELKFLLESIQNPKKPFYAVIGGAKIGSKMKVFQSLIDKVSAFFIGGGMAYTFFKAMGIPIGKSICDDEMIDVAKDFLKKAKEKNVPVHLPIDVVVADSFDNDANRKTVQAESGIEDSFEGMDIGPKTLEEWEKKLSDAKTVFWNGPMGVFELNHFAIGTFSMAKILAKLDAITVVGGGDSVSAISQLKMEDSFSHVSTGGGASLELIESGHLPGIDALSDK